MDTSTWIATLSFLVALLAAIYARWASFEPRDLTILHFTQIKLKFIKSFSYLSMQSSSERKILATKIQRNSTSPTFTLSFSSLSKPITKSNSILTPALILRENRSMPQGLMS
jgi:hypothetical protein